MLIKGLDGKEYKLKLNYKQSKKPSKLHIRARNLLGILFPNEIIYEEIRLFGSRKFNSKDLFADFFILREKLILETHGKQHYQKTFFHNSKLDFIQAKARDKRKKEWCELNNFEYIELPFGETDDEWKFRIVGRNG